MARIVLFDMDGTLIDSGEDITCSINHVRNALYALEPLSVREVVHAINAHSRNLAQIFYGVPVYEEAARERFETHYYDQCIQNVSAYEGIADVLKRLRGEGLALGVATNAPSVFAKRMLAHLKLEGYFDLILGADDVESPKPDPQMLYRHLEYHGYHPGTDNAWMIGDNSKDIEAARRAGISGIFAAWGFSREGEGDHVVSHPAEIPGIILQ